MTGRRSGRHGLVRQALALSGNDLGRRVVSGASYTFLGIAFRTLVTLGSMSILARLLTPADFGYIAMATVVTELAGLWGGFGFGNILIQRKTVTRLQFDTVFWASLAVGVALSCVVFMLSFFAGWFFKGETTGQLLRVLCWSFTLGGLTNVHEAIIARLLWFQAEFWIKMAVVFVSAATAVTFAYFGFGVWSLVAGPLAGSLTSVLLYFSKVPYLPRLRFHRAYLLSTWKTSGSYFGSGFLYYANMNVDTMLIGRHLGAHVLGYYQNARSLTDEIRGRIAMPLQRVLFPAFSALQSKLGQLQDSVLRSGRLLAAITIPVGVGVSAVAEDIVPVLYGPQWLEMIPVLGMFGINAAVRASTALSFPLFNSRNQVALALRYNAIGTLLMVISVIVTLPYGIHAVSIAIVLSNSYALFTYRVAIGLIGLNTRHLAHIFGPSALAAAIMWASIALIRPTTTLWLAQPGIMLPAHILMGAAIYAIALHLISDRYLKDFVEIFRKIRGTKT